MLEAAGISVSEAIELLCNGAPANDFVAAALGRNAASGGVPELLQETQGKDAEDVRAGRRAARSLWAFQKADLEDAKITTSRTSEYDREPESW